VWDESSVCHVLEDELSRRLLKLIGVTAAIMAVTVLLKLAPVPVGGRTALGSLVEVAAHAQTVPGEPAPAVPTPWGEADLQGIWTAIYEIPLERPPRFADQEFFTDEERAELDEERARIISGDTRRASRGSEQDVGGAYAADIYLSHKHLGRRTSLIVDPPDGRIPALTPEAQERRDAIREYQLALLQATEVCRNDLPACAGGQYGSPSPRRLEPPPYYPATGAAGGGAFNRADGPEDRGLGERCMSARLPDLGSVVGFFLEVVQSPGTVSMFYDTGQGQGWERIIPVTDRPHLPSHVRQWWGDSRARWEGDTLVVDVANFSSKTDYRGSRENLHLTERWTRIDVDTLEYVVTMEDPTTWTRPWTAALELKRQSNEANRVYKEPRCHEGNYGMPGLLAGARLEEQAFSEGQGPDPATLCSAGCGGFAAGFADSGADSNPLQR